MSQPWIYVTHDRRCPCGEAGAAVLDGRTDRCLSHGHQGLPEALRWARKQNLAPVLADAQREWLEGWCDREGHALKEGWTAYDALDLLDGISGLEPDLKTQEDS